MHYNYLYHHGIIGQKWGIRRFQNSDGTYTQAGKERYRAKNDRQANRLAKYQEKEYKRAKETYDSEKMLNEARRNRLKNKRETAFNKGNIRKVNKLDERIKLQEDEMKSREKIAKQVLNNIKDMKVSDMRRENIMRGATIAATLLVDFGSASAAYATGMPFYMIAIPNPEGPVKTAREGTAKKDLINKSKH